MRYALMYLLLVITALSLAAAMTIPVLAQNPTGSIRGLVTDQQGAVIPDAAVTVTNRATGDVRKVKTRADGTYSVENLLPGEFEVKVEAEGFATQVQILTVQVGNTTSADFSLTVGVPTEIIEIEASAPTIDKSNYKIDGVISRQKIDALPLNGRNFLQLALLEPGVSVSVSNPGQSNNLFNVSIGGGEVSLTRITVDGGNVGDPVTGGAAQNFSTETIQEFQISTFNFDLSTGITALGAINIVSRTGTNDYHGNGFVFYRDRHLAAAPMLKRIPSNPDPFFRRFQYGGSFGGPIKKDRAFFFGNVEWLNQDAAISTVHTGFSGFSQFDTTTTSPYDGVVINARGDFKLNDRNGLFVRFSRDDNHTFAPDDINTLPSNWRVNSNDDNNAQVGLVTLWRSNLINDLRFNYQRIKNDNALPTAKECPPSNPGCIGLGGPQIRVHNSNIVFGNSFNAPQNRVLDRYQVTDNVNWQKGSHRLRLGGEWEHDHGTGIWAFFDPALIAMHDPRNVMAANNAVSILLLPAAVKAALRIPLPTAFTSPSATITLNDILQLPIAIAVVGIGDPAQPPPFQASKAQNTYRYRFYAQDSWTVRPGFTLTYGASYQFETTLLNHDLPKPALLKPLVGTLDKPAKDKNNIAPSMGFAWDVGNKGKTVIRGGAGMYYDTVLFVTRLRERAVIGPAGDGRSQVLGTYFRNTLSFPQIPGLPSPFNQINPSIGAPIHFISIPTKLTGANFLTLLNDQIPTIQDSLKAAGSAGLTSIDFFKTGFELLDSNMQVPYSEHFSVGVQRQLPHNMTLSADFVLRKRLHTLFQNDRNLYDRVAARGGAIIPQCIGDGAFDPKVQCSNGPMNMYQSSGREQYKALLVKLNKRLSHRYQFTASYALSSLTGFFTSEDLTNWFGSRGSLGPDARHRFTFSSVVDLPLGFQASLIAVYASRPPLNARVPANIDLNGDGTTNDTLPGLKINSLGRSTSKKDLIRLVDEFNQNYAGKTDARGAAIPLLVLPNWFGFNDNFHSHDVRLSRTFKFGERYSIQALVEVFNLFNIANLTGFSSTLDAGSRDAFGEIVPPSSFSFGQPTLRVGQNFGTGGPRAFQLGLRFSF